MTRTWEARGKWMDKHGAEIKHVDDYAGYSTCHCYWRGSDGAQHVYGAPTPNDVIDLAMSECERLEREAAEQAKRAEAAKDRSPIAALLAKANRESSEYSIAGILPSSLRAAITAQAAEFRRWEKSKKADAGTCTPRSLWHDGAAYGFSVAADLLEGKA